MVGRLRAHFGRLTGITGSEELAIRKDDTLAGIIVEVGDVEGVNPAGGERRIQSAGRREPNHDAIAIDPRLFTFRGTKDD